MGKGRVETEERNNVEKIYIPVNLANVCAATDVGFHDLSNLLEQAARRANMDIAQKQGFIFEVVKVYEYNQQAALKVYEHLDPQNVFRNIKHRAIATAAIKGGGTSPIDVVIVDPYGNILKGFQLKSSDDPIYVLKETFKSKYNNIPLVTNKDTAQKAIEKSIERAKKGNIYQKEYLEDIPDKIKSEIAYGGIKSRGITYDEVVEITKNPELYVVREKAKMIAREVGTGVALTFLTGVGISVFFDLLYRGKIDKQTFKNALKQTGISSLYSAGSSAIRILTKANPVVVSAFSNLIVDTFLVAKDVIRGKMDLDEGFVRLCQSGLSSSFSIMTGLFGLVIGGPVGGFVGGLAGHVVLSSLFGFLNSNTQELKLLREQTWQTQQASLILIEHIRYNTQKVVDTINHISGMLNDAECEIDMYSKTQDLYHLERIYEIFGWEKPSEQEIINRILSDKPLII